MTTTPPQPPPVGSVTREQATAIAREAISGLQPSTEYELYDDQTVATGSGWVFFFGLPYGDGQPARLVVGLGPLVVEKANGQATFLTTSVPPDVAILEFERERADGSTPAPREQ